MSVADWKNSRNNTRTGAMFASSMNVPVTRRKLGGAPIPSGGGVPIPAEGFSEASKSYSDGYRLGALDGEKHFHRAEGGDADFRAGWSDGFGSTRWGSGYHGAQYWCGKLPFANLIIPSSDAEYRLGFDRGWTDSGCKK